jgi:phosphoadenosine phosphosulfate reductase
MNSNKSQGDARSQLKIFELDYQTSPPILKINPLVSWDYDQVWNYVKLNEIPYNVLHDSGFFILTQAINL